MSKRNGDKARARREQQKKFLRCQHTQELRQGLAHKVHVDAVLETATVETKRAHTD